MKYDWHQSDETEVFGIYRVINASLQIFEPDFIQLQVPGTGNVHLDWGIRVELLSNLLNCGIITERQAVDAVLMMKISIQGGKLPVNPLFTED